MLSAHSYNSLVNLTLLKYLLVLWSGLLASIWASISF